MVAMRPLRFRFVLFLAGIFGVSKSTESSSSHLRLGVACGDRSNAQLSAAPYQVFVSHSEYRVGEDLEVTISSKGNATYIAFFIEAVPLECHIDGATGLFNATADTFMQNYNCTNSKSHFGGISYNSVPISKAEEVSVVWTPSSTTKGYIEFRATVFETNDTYWTGIKSAAIANSEDLPCDIGSGASSSLHQTLLTIFICTVIFVGQI